MTSESRARPDPGSVKEDDLIDAVKSKWLQLGKEITRTRSWPEVAGLHLELGEYLELLLGTNLWRRRK